MKPLRDLARTLERRYRRLVCRLADHVPSWTLAVALGVTDAPVCERCGEELRT